MDPSTPLRPPNVTPPKCPYAPKKINKFRPNIDIQAIQANQANIIPTILSDDMNEKIVQNNSKPPSTPN